MNRLTIGQKGGVMNSLIIIGWPTEALAKHLKAHGQTLRFIYFDRLAGWPVHEIKG